MINNTYYSIKYNAMKQYVMCYANGVVTTFKNGYQNFENRIIELQGINWIPYSNAVECAEEYERLLSLRSVSILKSCEVTSRRLPLETKNTLQLENGSLGFIETLHKQHSSLQHCLRPLAYI